MQDHTDHSESFIVEPRITMRRLAKLLGVSSNTIMNWVKAGRFPAPHRIGDVRMWKLSVVAGHLAKLK